MAKFQKIRYFQSLIASQKSLRYGSDGYGAGPGVWTDGSDPIWTHLTHNIGVCRLQNLTKKITQNCTVISAIIGSDSPFGVRYGSDGYGVCPGVRTDGCYPIWPIFFGLEAPLTEPKIAEISAEFKPFCWFFWSLQTPKIWVRWGQIGSEPLVHTPGPTPYPSDPYLTSNGLSEPIRAEIAV